MRLSRHLETRATLPSCKIDATSLHARPCQKGCGSHFYRESLPLIVRDNDSQLKRLPRPLIGEVFNHWNLHAYSTW